MKKIKSFWYVFKRSISDFSYYKDVVKAPFSFSLKYLFLLLFFVSLLLSLKIAVQIAGFIPKVPALVTEIKTSATTFYPKELVLKVTNGQVSTNVKEPYYLDIPAIKDSHFITIDTKANAQDITKYNTLVLVIKDAIVAKDKESSYRVYPLTQQGESATKDFTLDKAVYDKLVSQATPYLNYITPLATVGILLVIFVLPFIGAAFDLLGKLIYLLLMALIIFVIAKIMKKKLSYSKVYQISMHALTPSIILVLVFNLAGLVAPAFIPSILLIAFASLAISKAL